MIQSRHIILACILSLPLTLLSCSIFGPDGGGINDPLKRGLISHYPLNGNARDAAGGHDGELFGTTPAEDRFGIEGKALAFDGTDDFVLVAESEDFNFDLREDSYTISLWAQSDDVEHWARLVVKWDELTPTPYPFAIQKVGGEVWGTFFDTQGKPTVEMEDAWDGGWHHIVVAYDAESDRLAGYPDGELVAERVDAPRQNTQNNTPVYIGRAASPVENRYFNGSMDDLRFYERALTEREVRALFDAED